MVLVLLSVAVVGLVMAFMAVGVLFGNRCLRGSCGGPEVLGPDGEPLTCADCPRRKARQGEAALGRPDVPTSSLVS